MSKKQYDLKAQLTAVIDDLTFIRDNLLDDDKPLLCPHCDSRFFPVYTSPDSSIPNCRNCGRKFIVSAIPDCGCDSE